MKKKIKYFLVILICIAQFISCGKRERVQEKTIEDENYEEDKISLFNNEEMTFLNNFIEAKIEEILSENDFKSEDVINIADEDFRVVLKKLCRRQAANCDYEIYATVYQVFLWDSRELREVFIDEYRDYSLVDEETYLSGDQYNTYRCIIDDDILIMKGARLILDAEGNVCGVDTEPRRFQYVNGYFKLTEDIK